MISEGLNINGGEVIERSSGHSWSCPHRKCRTGLTTVAHDDATESLEALEDLVRQHFLSCHPELDA